MYADERFRGAPYTSACVLAAALPAVAAHRLTRHRPLLRGAAVAAVVWAVTGARALTQEAERAARALDTDDLETTQAVLPGLCSWDPAHLGAKEIARAVVESVAENTSDAAVAPLVRAALAGLPGLAAYRAVNTLDAMVGYRSPRYERFGWASARLDDVANWARHPSPNAGRPEAAFAGALGLRLGGINAVGTTASIRPRVRPPRSCCLFDQGHWVALRASTATLCCRR